MNKQVIASDEMMSFETTIRTDVGCVRKLNEDSVMATPASGLWVVADGMGGHTAGDFASQTICKAMDLSLIHISEPTRRTIPSRMPSSA